MKPNVLFPVDIVYFSSNITPEMAVEIHSHFCKKHGIVCSYKRRNRDAALVRGILMTMLYSAGYSHSASGKVFNKNRTTAYYFYKMIPNILSIDDSEERRLFNLFVEEYVLGYDIVKRRAVVGLPGAFDEILSNSSNDMVLNKIKTTSVEAILDMIRDNAVAIQKIVDKSKEDYLKNNDILAARKMSADIYIMFNHLSKRIMP